MPRYNVGGDAHWRTRRTFTIGEDKMAKHNDSGMTVRFWGVRGSIPAPLRNTQVEEKIVQVVLTASRNGARFDDEDGVRDWLRRNLPFDAYSTFGGNTACIEIRCNEELIILDMGSGLRELGKDLMRETVTKKGLRGVILQSHVHWDHIQGFPFWSQLYLPRAKFANSFTFFGGKMWDVQLETVLAGQMNPPVFPVSFGELKQTGMQMDFRAIHDGWLGKLGEMGVLGENAEVMARKLNHPQETFGYRISFAGKTVAYTTDHEPYAAGLPAGLVELVQGADIWITDCQYNREGYMGSKGGPARHGWGHSFPDYLAEVALAAKPKAVITFHHDPEADDPTVRLLAERIHELCGIRTAAAFEGMELDLE